MYGRGPTIARLDSPAGPSTTLAIVADLHLGPGGRGTWRCLHRTTDRLRTVVREVNRLAVDGLVLAGDVTHDGTPGQFDALAAALEDLAVPAVAVPGNSDLGSDGDGLAGRFLDELTPGEFPLVRTFGDVGVVGIDTAGLAVGEPAGRGRVGPAQRRRIAAALAGEEVALAVLHHPLTGDRWAGGDGPPRPRPLDGAGDLAEALAAAGVELAITGHAHCPGLGRRGDLREVGAPAACSFPPSFLLVHVEPRGTTVSMVPLAHRLGLEETFQHAIDGPGVAREVADAVTGGYLDRFPLVDERGEGFAAAEAPTAGDLVRLPR